MNVIRATIRDAGDEWHIECRMKDGRKGAFVRVDKEYDELAMGIASFLNDSYTKDEMMDFGIMELRTK